jgi:hypothetical protein
MWVAVCDGEYVELYHGPHVEFAQKCLVSGAWAGDFKSGDIDKTDLVVGTGIKFYDDKIIFVTAGNTLDPIYYYEGGKKYFSNSLSGMLSKAKLSLVKKYDYNEAFETIKKGINKYTKQIPVDAGFLNICYYRNIVYTPQTIQEKYKTKDYGTFANFFEYEKFLSDSVKKISENASSNSRKFPIQFISTISSGYDSAIASIYAKKNGCSNFVTITNARSWINKRDSGEIYAEHLGIKCVKYTRGRKEYPDEISCWSTTGSNGDISLTIFDYPEPVSMLFCGFGGDKVWDRKYHDINEMQRSTVSGLRFSEYRIRKGIILISIPFLGIQNINQIQNISVSDEMKPWTLYNNYDRPIARRIATMYGIPNKIFARKKAVTSFAQYIPRPYPLSQSLRSSFKEYARLNSEKLPSLYRIKAWEAVGLIIWHSKKMNMKVKYLDKFYDWDPFPNRWLFFNWAVEILQHEYEVIFENKANKQ